ncbi:MAG: hypothetical protein V1704_01435 [Candidatus Vogelbacteria bacterium]
MVTVTEETEQTGLRPFHETIVEAIEQIWSSEEAGVLARLIKRTKISKDHDKIVTTWKRKLGEFGQSEDYLDVPANLLEQKKEAEKGETDLASSFDFDGKERVLMLVIERIIGVFQNLTPTTKSQFPSNRMDDIFKLFETAKRIFLAEDEGEFQTAIADL